MVSTPSMDSRSCRVYPWPTPSDRLIMAPAPQRGLPIFFQATYMKKGSVQETALPSRYNWTHKPVFSFSTATEKPIAKERVLCPSCRSCRKEVTLGELRMKDEPSQARTVAGRRVASSLRLQSSRVALAQSVDGLKNKRNYLHVFSSWI